MALKEMAKPYISETDKNNVEEAEHAAIVDDANGLNAGKSRNAGALAKEPVLGGSSGYLIKRR